MAIFISLVKFTREGVMTLKEEGIKRSDKVRKTIESLGGKLLDAYYCLGPYDVVAIHEFPDTQAAMKAAVLNSSLGSMQITTMAAVSRDEWRKLLKEMWPKGK